jgi:uncharacterized protein YcbX
VVVGRVSGIAIAPVKGLALAHPGAVELGQTGVPEDRRFYLVDADGRLLNGKAEGTLVRIRAEAAPDGSALVLRFPDGTAVAGSVELGEPIETGFYGRPVAGRVVVGPWAEALSSFVGRDLRLVRVASDGHGVDRGIEGCVSLIGTASLAQLAEQAGVPSVDGRRFRMLFTVSGLDPHAEDGWVGREIEVGAAHVRVLGLVGRCAVTTHDPDTGVPTLDTLHVLRDHRGDVPTVEPLPFGVRGEVVRPGRVAVGDPVRPVDP